MKKLFTLSFIFTSIYLSTLSAQNKKIYSPEDNAQLKIDSAISVAAKENKFILLQVGGNWCAWCIKFTKFSQETPEIKKTLDDNFVVYHLNYSKENKNEAILASLGFPQRFGFPVFVILNNKGERIHTQQSDFLEDGSTGYDTKKVENFLTQWSPQALNPKTYKK